MAISKIGRNATDTGISDSSDATAITISSAELVTVANGLTLTDGDVTVASGHGISFAATSDGTTMSSELFDDYEEGTFEATMGGHTNIGTAAAAITAGPGGDGTARYTKIGRMVHFSIYFFNESTTTQASGNLLMNGLPFANAGNSSIINGTATYNVDLSAENVTPTFQTSSSSLYGLTLRDSNTWADTGASILPNNTAIYFYVTGTYEAT
jgi:hypothetical protein